MTSSKHPKSAVLGFIFNKDCTNSKCYTCVKCMQLWKFPIFWDISLQCHIRSSYVLLLKEQTQPNSPAPCCAIVYMNARWGITLLQTVCTEASSTIVRIRVTLSDSPCEDFPKYTRNHTWSVVSPRLSLSHATEESGKVAQCGNGSPSTQPHRWLWGTVYSPKEELGISSSCANLL